jgi:hypothetical protein
LSNRPSARTAGISAHAWGELLIPTDARRHIVEHWRALSREASQPPGRRQSSGHEVGRLGSGGAPEPRRVTATVPPAGGDCHRQSASRAHALVGAGRPPASSGSEASGRLAPYRPGDSRYAMGGHLPRWHHCSDVRRYPPSNSAICVDRW